MIVVPPSPIPSSTTKASSDSAAGQGWGPSGQEKALAKTETVTDSGWMSPRWVACFEREEEERKAQPTIHSMGNDEEPAFAFGAHEERASSCATSPTPSTEIEQSRHSDSTASGKAPVTDGWSADGSLFADRAKEQATAASRNDATDQATLNETDRLTQETESLPARTDAPTSAEEEERMS